MDKRYYICNRSPQGVVEHHRVPKVNISQGVSTKPSSDTQSKTVKHKEAVQITEQKERKEGEAKEQMEHQRGRTSILSAYDDSEDEYDRASRHSKKAEKHWEDVPAGSKATLHGDKEVCDQYGRKRLLH